jgi:hypothetical protein
MSTSTGWGRLRALALFSSLVIQILIYEKHAVYAHLSGTFRPSCLSPACHKQRLKLGNTSFLGMSRLIQGVDYSEELDHPEKLTHDSSRSHKNTGRRPLESIRTHPYTPAPQSRHARQL